MFNGSVEPVFFNLTRPCQDLVGSMVWRQQIHTNLQVRLARAGVCTAAGDDARRLTFGGVSQESFLLPIGFRCCLVIVIGWYSLSIGFCCARAPVTSPSTPPYRAVGDGGRFRRHEAKVWEIQKARVQSEATKGAVRH
eukprot:20206-Chlamydomonas_euryale.AAC.1